MKETDRIAAMATELRKLGAHGGGGRGLPEDHAAGEAEAGVAIDTYDDHRMAMCFSLAALGGVPVRINDPDCVAKTFPDTSTSFAIATCHQGQTRSLVPAVAEKWCRLLPMNAPVIAIDGPSASGKGTVAQPGGRALGFHYLDSGALYRLVALLALREGLADEAAIAHAAEHMDVVFEEDEILLEDQDVSSQIRHETVGNRASEVARYAGGAAGAAGAPAGVPAAARAGRRRARHGDRRVPGRGAQGFPDREPGGAGRAQV